MTGSGWALAAREPRFRQVTAAWMERSRAALEQHFDPATARRLEALIEGLTIHRSLDAVARDATEVAAEVEAAVRRIVGIREP